MRAGRIGWRVAMGSMLLVLLFGSPAGGLKNKSESGKTIDSGSFAVWVNGQRVATETFHILQGEIYSTASSEFKGETGDKVIQKAELQVTSSGEFHRYEWHETTPHKEEIVVEPSESFMVEHVVPEAPERPVTQPFMLPLTTIVLDDYFFSQRELLVWRYLAQSCGGNLQQCRPGTMQFGALIPRRQMPVVVTVENAGPEKVNLNGSERDLNRIILKIPEEADWTLYVDLNFKLLRISIPAENTEVVRQ